MVVVKQELMSHQEPREIMEVVCELWLTLVQT